MPKISNSSWFDGRVMCEPAKRAKVWQILANTSHLWASFLISSASVDKGKHWSLRATGNQCVTYVLWSGNSYFSMDKSKRLQSFFLNKHSIYKENFCYLGHYMKHTTFFSLRFKHKVHYHTPKKSQKSVYISENNF